MSSFRPGRFAGILLGTVAILAIGVFAPLVALAPLPPASITDITPRIPTASPVSLDLDGAAALRASGAQYPLASSDAETARPMASISKIITALVVLEAKPMSAGDPGGTLTIGSLDYADYINYSNEDARTVIVFPGETWTQQETLQAMLLGSSNNHADTLARWAFGSIDEFLAASTTWLGAQGLTSTALADATGLSEQSAGTANDLSQLAELALANPVITDILGNPVTSLVNKRGVSNTTPFLEDRGVTGISTSYTDAGGVCFLFRLDVDSSTGPVPLFGVVLGSPGYAELENTIRSLVDTAPAGVEPVVVIAKNTAYAIVETAWGQRIEAVAGKDVLAPGWELNGATPTVSFDDPAAVNAAKVGNKVGRVTLDTLNGSVSTPLVMSASVNDPGPLWRLSNPMALLTGLLGSAD